MVRTANLTVIFALLQHFPEIQKHPDIIFFQDTVTTLNVVSKLANNANVMFAPLITEWNGLVGSSESIPSSTVIFIELTTLQFELRQLLNRISAVRNLNPWIFIRYCTADESYDNESSVSFIKGNLPQDYQLNSHVYVMLCNDRDISELYYFKSKLISRSFNLLETISTTARRRSFMQETIVAGLAKPLNLLEKTPGAFSSVTHLLLNYTQDSLNFTIKYQYNPDWTGMSTSTENLVNDVGMSATGMIESAVLKYRFLNTPTYTDTALAYFSKPRNSGPLFVHAKPFCLDSWLGLATISTVLVISHFVMSGELMKSVFWIVSCLSSQGYPTEGYSNSLRIVAFVGSLLGVIVNAVYSGELISSLSTKTEPTYTLNELIDNGFAFGITNDSYLHAARKAGDYAKATGSVASQMFRHLHKEFDESDIHSGILNALENEQYAFVTEESVYEMIASQVELKNPKYMKTLSHLPPLCEVLRDIELPEYTVQQAPIVRRDSQFVNHFNFARIRSRETGIWSRIQSHRALTIKMLKPKCASEIHHPFSIPDVLLPVCIILGGFGLTWFSLLVELVCNKLFSALKN